MLAPLLFGCADPDRVFRYRSPLTLPTTPAAKLPGELRFSSSPDNNFRHGLPFVYGPYNRTDHQILEIKVAFKQATYFHRSLRCLRNHWMTKKMGGCKEFDLVAEVTVTYLQESEKSEEKSMKRSYLARMVELPDLNVHQQILMPLDEIIDGQAYSVQAIEIADSLGLTLWPIVTRTTGQRFLALPLKGLGILSTRRKTVMDQFYSVHNVDLLKSLTRGYRSPILQPTLVRQEPRPHLHFFDNRDIPPDEWIPHLMFRYFGEGIAPSQCELTLIGRNEVVEDSQDVAAPKVSEID